MKIETKIASLTVAFALTAGAAAQAAEVNHANEQAATISLLKSLRSKPTTGASLLTSSEVVKDVLYSGLTER